LLTFGYSCINAFERLSKTKIQQEIDSFCFLGKDQFCKVLTEENAILQGQYSLNLYGRQERNSSLFFNALNAFIVNSFRMKLLKKEVENIRYN